jgi:hypothetical protein
MTNNFSILGLEEKGQKQMNFEGNKEDHPLEDWNTKGT